LSGTTPDGATGRVSLHDPHARPIAKGRLGRPVEFGYKAQVVDNDDGIVLDHTVERGNPADAPQLAPAVGRVIARTGRRPPSCCSRSCSARCVPSWQPRPAQTGPRPPTDRVDAHVIGSQNTAGEIRWLK
jgi:hypothetical protein